MIERLQISTKQ